MIRTGTYVKILKKNLILILAMLAVVALILFNLPQLKAWRLRGLAAEQIQSYVDLLQTSSPDVVEGLFYCLLPLFHEGVEPPIALNEAIQSLNQARQLDPRDSHGNFLLGQAFCLQQEYKQAIDAFDRFLARRSDNLLAKAESGFAAVALAHSISDPQKAQTYRTKGLQSLEEAGFSNNHLIKLGDESFKQEKYKDALFWYEVSDSFSGLQGVTSFRYALLQLVFKGSSPYADQIKEGMILELDEELTFEPTNLFELSTGVTLPLKFESNQTIGMLYSNSQEAGVMLNVMESNRFCVSIFALDEPPQPTQIGVDLDFETITTIELMNGDGEWVKFDFDIYLDQGFHVLGIKLLNDKHIAGVDRNAHIGNVTIKACQEE